MKIDDIIKKSQKPDDITSEELLFLVKVVSNCRKLGIISNEGLVKMLLGQLSQSVDGIAVQVNDIVWWPTMLGTLQSGLASYALWHGIEFYSTPKAARESVIKESNK